MTVTPGESPRFLGGARMMFRGIAADRSTDIESSGRVVVFASVVDYGDLTAGRPATFRARIARPTRRDLTVAVLTATGEPTLGDASAVAAGGRRRARRLRRRGARGAAADQAAMLPALVLGDTSALDRRRRSTEFRAAGLTHLTAVSGANVTIVCGAVLLAAAAGRPAGRGRAGRAWR